MTSKSADKNNVFLLSFLGTYVRERERKHLNNKQKLHEILSPSPSDAFKEIENIKNVRIIKNKNVKNALNKKITH